MGALPEAQRKVCQTGWQAFAEKIPDNVTELHVRYTSSEGLIYYATLFATLGGSLQRIEAVRVKS